VRLEAAGTFIIAAAALAAVVQHHIDYSGGYKYTYTYAAAGADSAAGGSGSLSLSREGWEEGWEDWQRRRAAFAALAGLSIALALSITQVHEHMDERTN
jgi:hypothetical protein